VQPGVPVAGVEATLPLGRTSSLGKSTADLFDCDLGREARKNGLLAMAGLNEHSGRRDAQGLRKADNGDRRDAKEKMHSWIGVAPV